MVKIRKADGTLEEFDEEKIRTSLKRAGTDDRTIDYIITHVRKKVSEGMSTDAIYAHIFDILKDKNHPMLTRYNLKRAIMDLGPTGYPFEKFVAGILEKYEYIAETNQIVSGACVDHEVDIIARKQEKRIMLECKFHNRSGTKSGIRTALYTHARFLDVKDKNNFQEHWLVTNTKVTSEATNYARCVGMKIVAWNYPHDFSLRQLIERSNLHPITAVDTLSKQEKKSLLQSGVIFVRDWEKRKSWKH